MYKIIQVKHEHYLKLHICLNYGHLFVGRPNYKSLRTVFRTLCHFLEFVITTENVTKTIFSIKTYFWYK